MDIQVGEEMLPYMELCRILADGLENVCDALKKLEKDRREVSVHMRYHRDYLLIRIRNRCQEDLYVKRGETVPTSKTEKDMVSGFLPYRRRRTGLMEIWFVIRRMGGLCWT